MAAALYKLYRKRTTGGRPEAAAQQKSVDPLQGSAGAPRGHVYDGNSATDHARVHNGDMYIQGDYHAAVLDGPRSLAEECMRSLHYPEMRSLDSAPTSALEGTCSWIWSNQELGFESWLQHSDEPFWIQGQPGSGKTTLVGYLAADSHLKEVLAAMTDSRSCGQSAVAIATHYFQANNADIARSIEGMLRSILWQLSQSLTYAIESLAGRYQRLRNTMSVFKWSVAELEAAFYDLVSVAHSAIICIFVDGLDEYNGDDEELASYLDKLSHATATRVRFCFSSRPYPDFKFQFRTLRSFRMQEQTSGDIAIYVNHRFGEALKLDDKAMATLAHHVLWKAESSFLWVRLACDELHRRWRRHRSLSDLHRCLQDMPHELTTFYQRILDGLEPDELDDLVTMVNIVVASAGPLSLIEFCHAMDLGRSDEKQIEPAFLPWQLKQHFAKEKMTIKTPYVPACTCEVISRHRISDRESSAGTCNHPFATPGTDDCVHERIELTARGLLTVKDEYILVAHETVLHFWRLRQDAMVGHIHLLRACTSYLCLLTDCFTFLSTGVLGNSFTFLSTDAYGDKELEYYAKYTCRARHYPFLAYTRRYLSHHMRASEQCTEPETVHSIISALSTKALRVWDMIQDEEKLLPGLSLLEFCVEFGVHLTASQMLSAGKDIYRARRDLTLPSSLQEDLYASLKGLEPQEVTVKLMEDEQMTKAGNTPALDVNSNDGRLLFLAARHNNTAIIAQLFDLGARVDSRLRYACSALHRAIYHGNRDVAGAMVKHICLDASPESRGTWRNQLQCEARLFAYDTFWRRECFESNIISSVLQFAAAMGNPEIVGEILFFYPNHEHLLGSREDALVTATYYNHPDIVRMLLLTSSEAVQDYTRKRYRGRRCMKGYSRRHSCSAILAAVDGGFVEVLQHLLSADENPNLEPRCDKAWISLRIGELHALPLHLAILDMNSPSIRKDAGRAMISLLVKHGAALHSSVREILPKLVESHDITAEDMAWLNEAVPVTCTNYSAPFRPQSIEQQDKWRPSFDLSGRQTPVPELGIRYLSL